MVANLDMILYPDAQAGLLFCCLKPPTDRFSPVKAHTFDEIDHEIVLLSFSSFKTIQDGLLSVTCERI